MKLHKINLLIIFLIALSFYGYFIRLPDWNIASRLSLVRAVVEEKRLSIDSFAQGELSTNDKANFNGHYYSDKAIGASLLGVLAYFPIYILLGHPLPTVLFIMLITVLAISIPSALLAPLLYDNILRMVKGKWIALLISLTICLGTPIFPYAGAFYGHSLAAVLAISVFFLWMDVNQFNTPITPSRVMLSGFLIGFMVLTEYTTLIIAIILTVYIVYVVRLKQTSWNWKTIGWFFAGGAIPFVLFVSYNWICFGSPLTVGYANESLPEFQELHGEGLVGIGWPNLETLLYMTIHPMMGIFVQAPVLLLAVGGFFVMRRERKMRAELVVLTSIILAFCLAISGVKHWWGGNSVTVRYLIPILPFFGVFMIFLPRKYHVLSIGLGLVSFFNMLIATAAFYPAFDQRISETVGKGFSLSWGTSLLYQELLPKLIRNKLNFTWGEHLLGVESWYLNLAIPLIAFIVLLGIFYFVNRYEDKSFTTITSSQEAKSSNVE